jgi:hypothetical protein
MDAVVSRAVKTTLTHSLSTLVDSGPAALLAQYYCAVYFHDRFASAGRLDNG